MSYSGGERAQNRLQVNTVLGLALLPLKLGLTENCQQPNRTDSRPDANMKFSPRFSVKTSHYYVSTLLAGGSVAPNSNAQ